MVIIGNSFSKMLVDKENKYYRIHKKKLEMIESDGDKAEIDKLSMLESELIREIQSLEDILGLR